MLANIDEIIEELTDKWDAIVSLSKGGKRIIFLNDVEYTINNDEQLLDFYRNFCGMNKYLD